MVQSLSSLSAKWSDRILCYYENVTEQIQLVRIANIPGWLFERVVFPHQRLLFEALPDALFEVHGCTPAMTVLDRIPCLRLRVKEMVQFSLEVSYPEGRVD
jgi:hypothetical protein